LRNIVESLSCLSVCGECFETAGKVKNGSFFADDVEVGDDDDDDEEHDMDIRRPGPKRKLTKTTTQTKRRKADDDGKAN
jgi:hypothetical protein